MFRAFWLLCSKALHFNLTEWQLQKERVNEPSDAG
jgi:hypothetical protein